MPANYAFYRFGAEALKTLPEQQRRPIQRFRRLYNGGLLGADLFFWFRPMVQSPVGELYHTYGSMNGREFFAQACDLLRQNPSEGAAACLYGLLANYCLNSQLSELFRKENAGCSRVELEVELDRYLLCLDGKSPAHRQDMSSNYHMTRGECVTLALFFPPATAANTYAAYRSMVSWSRRLTAKKRGFTEFLLKTARSDFRDQMMADHANHRCLHLDAAMEECCSRALEQYAEMARQLAAYREEGIPLGDLFNATFR